MTYLLGTWVRILSRKVGTNFRARQRPDVLHNALDDPDTRQLARQLTEFASPASLSCRADAAVGCEVLETLRGRCATRSHGRSTRGLAHQGCRARSPPWLEVKGEVGAPNISLRDRHTYHRGRPHPNRARQLCDSSARSAFAGDRHCTASPAAWRGLARPRHPPRACMSTRNCQAEARQQAKLSSRPVRRAGCLPARRARARASGVLHGSCLLRGQHQHAAAPTVAGYRMHHRQQRGFPGRRGSCARAYSCFSPGSTLCAWAGWRRAAWTP